MFVKTAMQIGAFVLTFCIGLFSSVSRQVVTHISVEPETSQQNKTVQYTTIYPSASTDNCVEHDIYAERKRNSRIELQNMEKRLHDTRIKLAKLQFKWPMPEHPTEPNEEAIVAYFKEMDSIPEKVLTKIHTLEIEILKLSLRLDVLREEMDKNPEDLLYRERCIEF